uniref:DDE Tnp4 domain-containing protein n=1 Tax=Lactuca sativa TaxID=4236 RepID=A0A9R1XU59_LACSA|nr:hypothetical protein LSAT_V11C100034180 [Lactuca sativa]
MFTDYVDALDERYVRASVPQSEEAKYIGRKGYATQNIMNVCDFNMFFFTFVLAEWEGTTYDTRIFNKALRRPKLHFPHPTDKYYVVDADYLNTTREYLTPYKEGTRRVGA